MKLINGTWLELHHYNIKEGKYFNPMCHEFSDEQWIDKIEELASLNMKYIVLMSVAISDIKNVTKTFYDSKYFERSDLVKANNPIETILKEASKHNMKVFIGAGIFGYWSNVYYNMTNKEVHEKTILSMKELYELYGHYDSFYGWYYPDETGIHDYYEQEFIDYVNSKTAFSKQLNPNLKTLIAPYGTNHVKTDEKFVEQLKNLDVDFVAYQDEVGVKKSSVDETSNYYKQLKKAHDLANKSKLWADVEIFDFEGDVYKSALLPSNIERIKKQLIAVSPYVEEVLVFQYQGMMNRPTSISHCGHPDAIKFYKDYKNLVDESKKN